MQIPIFGLEKDLFFMSEALKCAQQALNEDEVPIGAVVVDPAGNIVSRGYNKVESLHTQMAHAEVDAIRSTTDGIKDWRLDGYWVYVTLEPCTMCMGLIRLSRFAGVVYGADSPLFGYKLDNDDNFRVYKKNAPLIISGVASEQSIILLQQFFKKKRSSW